MVNMDKDFARNFGLVILVIISLAVFVYAAASTITLPITGGNYTNPLNLSITVDANGVNNMTNVTCWYNMSGGATATFLTEIINTTSDQTVFENASIDISGYTELTTYNISCAIRNYSSATVFSANTTIYADSITFDSTPANVTAFANTVDGGNYNGTINLNVSVNDTTVGMYRGSVYFNVTDSLGTEVNWTQATSPSLIYYNMSLVTGDYSDGAYTITVWANDSLDNLNKTESIGITIDNTAPTITLSKTDSTTGSLELAIAISDTIGVNTCTVNRAGAVITGSGASQKLVEHGLACGISYSYTVTCTDSLSHSGVSTATSFSTKNCGGGSVSSSSGETTTWTNTFSVKNEQFTEGFTKQLVSKQRMKVIVNGGTHHVGVKSLTATKAVIEIASDPISVELAVGGEAKVDVLDDRYYDIYVKLNSITNGKADVTVQKIHELIPASAEGPLSTTGEDVTGQPLGEVETDEGGFPAWGWAIIIILVLAAVGGGIAVKNKR